MPSYIIDLYIYFLYPETKKSRLAFERFYNSNDSRHWVRCYATKGKDFYAKYMSKYSQEIREQFVKLGGITKPRRSFRK